MFFNRYIAHLSPRRFSLPSRSPFPLLGCTIPCFPSSLQPPTFLLLTLCREPFSRFHAAPRNRPQPLFFSCVCALFSSQRRGIPPPASPTYSPIFNICRFIPLQTAPPTTPF